MAQKVVLEDKEIKKIRAIANQAAKLGKSAKTYFELLRRLNKTVPKEARSMTAKYAAIVRKALRGENVDYAKLGQALIEMKKEWRSWKAERKQDIEIVRAAAREYFKDLRVLIDLTQ